MMVAMDPTCQECGGETEYVRSRYVFPLRAARVVAEEVPSVRCRECEHIEPAQHVLPQLRALLELADDAQGATARKNFGGMPLRPEEGPA